MPSDWAYAPALGIRVVAAFTKLLSLWFSPATPWASYILPPILLINSWPVTPEMSCCDVVYTPFEILYAEADQIFFAHYRGKATEHPASRGHQPAIAIKRI